MTDNEIIKALECCCDDKLSCRKCPYEVVGCITGNNENSLHKDALDLINRQKENYEALNAQEEKAHNYCKNECEPRYKAEIARLQGYNENLLTANTALSNEILEIKSEAYKEFAERLKKDCPGELLVIHFDALDNLVKELSEVSDNA